MRSIPQHKPSRTRSLPQRSRRRRGVRASAELEGHLHQAQADVALLGRLRLRGRRADRRQGARHRGSDQLGSDCLHAALGRGSDAR
eukprot:2905074-Prymnesium_polylepis.1